jgi:hypothetical protein
MRCRRRPGESLNVRWFTSSIPASHGRPAHSPADLPCARNASRGTNKSRSTRVRAGKSRMGRPWLTVGAALPLVTDPVFREDQPRAWDRVDKRIRWTSGVLSEWGRTRSRPIARSRRAWRLLIDVETHHLRRQVFGKGTPQSEEPLDGELGDVVAARDSGSGRPRTGKRTRSDLMPYASNVSLPSHHRIASIFLGP